MAVVLVHGFTQTPSSWAPVVGAPGVADLRPNAVAIPRAARFVDTAHAIGAAGGPATYVGYSQGGRLCMQLALDQPELVERLVLVSASPGIDDPDARAARRAADELLAQSIERDGVRAFLDFWISQTMFATLPPERAGIEERVSDNTVEWLAHQLRVLGQGSQPSNWERLTELQMPVLLIVGELDRKYVDIALHMSAAIPNARIEVIGDAGHACHLEQPETVAQLLASW